MSIVKVGLWIEYGSRTRLQIQKQYELQYSYQTSLEDGSPFLWEHKGSKVLMCFQQKCGSSAWKHVVKKQIADEANSTVYFTPGDIHKKLKTYYIENIKSGADNQLRDVKLCYVSPLSDNSINFFALNLMYKSPTCSQK